MSTEHTCPECPNWRDPQGVVHVVGLHTSTSIRTECGVVIVRSGDVFVQAELFEPCYEPPDCLTCVTEFDPY